MLKADEKATAVHVHVTVLQADGQAAAMLQTNGEACSSGVEGR